ncbi:MAG: hypothetical protein V4577_08275 [Bacteroidota bacterium]
MEDLLTELGVSKELQAFFNITEPLFNYGNDLEYFGSGIHFIPTTSNLWVAGNDMATELVITSSAMEAIAYLSLNTYRYPVTETICFIAIGNLPHAAQLNWIRVNRQKRKITLVFGNDLLGRLTDIAVACGLCNKAVRLCWSDGGVEVFANGKQFKADPELLTLNNFEKAAGVRTGIRTRKPIRHDTFLEQLKHDTNP